MSRKHSPDRRRFLAASAVTAALPAVSAAAEPDPKPLTGLIDCQSHLFPPELISLMEKRTTDPVVYTKDGTKYVRMGDWLRKVLPDHSDVDAKLKSMDKAGIRLTALSINDPGPEWFGDDGARVARLSTMSHRW